MPHETVYADLHTHTRCSDGVLSPEALVERVAERGVRVLSVTDHDTVEGVGTAQAAAEAHGLQFVSGVELSVTVEEREVHLLAYGVDPSHETLRRHLREMAEARKERLRRIVEQLRALGIDLHDEKLDAAMTSEGSVGRPHVAAALVRGGHVESVDQAFEEYLGRDRPGFVAKPEVPAENALSLVHEAGGVGVLAHPGHWTPSACIRRLVEAGLDGIETIHPSHDASLRKYYERLARGRGLLKTGGSDYHGGTVEEEEHLGTVGLTRAQWERFREAVS